MNILQLTLQWPSLGSLFYWKTKTLCFWGHQQRKGMIHFHLPLEPVILSEVEYVYITCVY